MMILVQASLMMITNELQINDRKMFIVQATGLHFIWSHHLHLRFPNMSSHWTLETHWYAQEKELFCWNHCEITVWKFTAKLDVLMDHLLLATLVSKTVSDSDMRQSCDYTCLGHLGPHDTDRIISVWIMLPEVAKASTIVTVVCCWHWRFHLKMLPMEMQLN